MKVVTLSCNGGHKLSQLSGSWERKKYAPQWEVSPWATYFGKKCSQLNGKVFL